MYSQKRGFRNIIIEFVAGVLKVSIRVVIVMKKLKIVKSEGVELQNISQNIR